MEHDPSRSDEPLRLMEAAAREPHGLSRQLLMERALRLHRQMLAERAAQMRRRGE